MMFGDYRSVIFVISVISVHDPRREARLRASARGVFAKKPWLGFIGAHQYCYSSCTPEVSLLLSAALSILLQLL